MTTKRGRGRPRTGNTRRHVMLDPELLERVKRRAEAEERNVSNMINVLIREALDGDTLDVDTLEKATAK